MAKCKSCGADIVWIETTNGKAMPCDAEPVPYWTVGIMDKKDRIMTLDGEIRACTLVTQRTPATGTGYKPHWANCTGASNHRRVSKNENNT